ncbi:MAG: DUF2812 domain-containing protein [Anaerolineaceae bacterium]|nr:MAG: DUF2812 domain-containing protein [Anaerolineaceae bacterium]
MNTMDKNRLRKFKLFFAWQDDKEEDWLREMARMGWHLFSLGLPGFYNFTRGEPRDVVYRLDFTTSKIDMDEYLQLFQDAGWEHLGSLVGWQYFRKPAEAEGMNEIYTDPESKIQRHQRLLGYLMLFLPIMIVLFTRIGDPMAYPFFGVMKLFSAVVLLLYAYAVVRIFMRINQLRRR